MTTNQSEKAKQYKFLKPGDIKIANKIADGWVASRDYDNSNISKGNEIIKISKHCYNRLYLEGLAD